MIRKIIIAGLSAFISFMLLLAAVVFFTFYYYGSDIPDYSQLKNYNPPVVTRLYAADGRLLEEYAREKRIFIPIEAMPKRVIKAFLAAEDRKFYKHSGIDYYSIARAVFQNFLNMGQGKGLIGGSTITQQVAKNFLLTNERSIKRKIKEAVLAIRMSAAFSKDRILELYLNEIFLGNGSYGVAAAALNYFNKSVAELDLEEAALLAALPKAPSSYDPQKNLQRALERRNWVINGMLEEGFVTKQEAEFALSKPITIVGRDRAEIARADFFAEEVRKEILKEFGQKSLYEDGLTVLATLDPQLQGHADKALRSGLIEYDKRHGYRGALAKLNIKDGWQEKIVEFKIPPVVEKPWEVAVVISASKEKAEIGLQDGSTGFITIANLSWARRAISDSTVGSAPTRVSSVLAKGDVIIVEKIDEKKPSYALRQVPEVEGAVVVQDPHSGKILAISGGFSPKSSKFNRATQAKRQPGSAFKPFVYLLGMENGFTPATVVDDAPIELDQGVGLPKWTPKNYSEEFYGPTTLRIGLEHSRNLITVRLATMVGVKNVAEVAKRFGINENAKALYSTALGSMETTLVDMVNAYSMLVNGGKKVKPITIEKVQDRMGKTIFRSDNRECSTCNVTSILDLAMMTPPFVPENREQVSDPRSTFQVISMLEGVVQRGTGTRALELNRVVGGKTGTTNDSYDAWFIGFTPDLVVGVFVGYDNPRTLGEKETGSSVALPIFVDFMEKALKDKPSVPFRIPEGIKMVKIDRKAGSQPTPATPPKDIIFEAFKTETDPPVYSTVRDALPSAAEESPVGTGTGGLY